MKKKSVQYHWSISADNVYNFLMFKYAGTIASYKNQVSGFVSSAALPEFFAALKSKTGWANLKMVTSKTYWKNYDHYNK